MTQALIGKCLIMKNSSGDHRKTIRIIHIDRSSNLVFYIGFPQVRKKRMVNYVGAPRVMTLDDIEKAVNDKEHNTLSDFKVPEHWLWSEDDLTDSVYKNNLQRRDRKKREKWKAVRDKSYALIQPFVEGRALHAIVMDPDLPVWPKKRAAELNVGSVVKISRALNAYLLGMGIKNALMPNYANCGLPGEQKFSTKDTGRPSIAALELGQKKVKPNLSSDTRIKLALGWKRYKKRGVSDRVALNKTKLDYFVKSISFGRNEKKVELLPESHDISEQMFRYWGQRSEKALSAKQLNRGLTLEKDEVQRRLNRARDRYDTVNGVGYIDSTSADQTLISSIHPLKRLKSPWRTEVMAASVDYIFGVYVGFESASASTALLSILSAATDKVEFCARYGHTITADEWLSCTFNTFEMDNGEGKGQLAMYTIEQMETSASYGAVYDAINKAASESGHHQRQKRNDHLMPGTTLGRQKIRGEQDRMLHAGLRFDDYMHLYIKETLFHNNKAYIDPTRLEMYPGLKERTRRGVVEWMIKHHYLSSATLDLDVLRVTCLPKFDAVMHIDGIHLYKPGSGSKEIIRNLVYRGEYLIESGLLNKCSRRAMQLKVHMNPVDLTHIWVNLNGLKRFDLASGDRDFEDVTLIDWLAITRDDKLAEFLSRKVRSQHEVEHLAEIKVRNKKGLTIKKELESSQGKMTKTAMKRDIRLMTSVEKAIHTGIPVDESLLDTSIQKSQPMPIQRPVDTSFKRTNSITDLWDDMVSGIYRAQEGGLDAE